MAETGRIILAVAILGMIVMTAYLFLSFFGLK